jgi:hypothetical protein
LPVFSSTTDVVCLSTTAGSGPSSSKCAIVKFVSCPFRVGGIRSIRRVSVSLFSCHWFSGWGVFEMTVYMRAEAFGHDNV